MPSPRPWKMIRYFRLDEQPPAQHGKPRVCTALGTRHTLEPLEPLVLYRNTTLRAEYRDRNCMLAHMLRATPARDPHRRRVF